MKLSKIYNENRLLILLVSILIILIGLPIVVLLMLNKTITAAAWYDTNWEHRKPITVSNDTGSTLSNEDVLVTVDTASLIAAGKLQNDCDDLRFLDSDDSTALDYWIEGGCNTSTTEVWVQIPSLPSEGKTIYMYYANPTATSTALTWNGDVIMYADTSCPEGWTRASDLDGKFLYGSDTYGVTGGSDSHAHGNVSVTSSSISTTNIAGSSSSGTSGSTTNHTHTGLEASVSSATSLPSYKEVVLCYKNDFNISSGLISMFNTSAPSGWSRFSALDNLFVRANASYGGTGGSDTHSHSATGGVATGINSESQNTITAPFSGTGGTTYTSGGDTIHRFTSSGTFTTNKSGSVQALVIAGGGGGGYKGGGGGAGGYIQTTVTVSSGSHSVTVGGGGAGKTSVNADGNNGANSVFYTLTAIGGGGGSSGYSARGKGHSGGSGGGTTAYYVGDEFYWGSGSYVPGQGRAAGKARNDNTTLKRYMSTGGGGAGGVAGNVTGTSGAGSMGGYGLASSITGSSVTRACGGSGYLTDFKRAGGCGAQGQNASSNTGSGGGGHGGNGGSGIVVVRYTTPISPNGVIASSSHTHTSSATTTSTDSNLPPYLNMIFAKADASTYLTSDNVVAMTSLPPLGWSRFTQLDDKFPKAADTYGATGGSSTHTHSLEIATGGPSATLDVYESGVNFADSTHTHSGVATTDSQSNLPAYTTVIYSQRTDSQSTVLGSEESQVPNAPTAQSATPTSTSEITWNFTDNSDNETGFKVYDTSDVLKVTCSSPNISSCLESSLSENTQYTRKFLAYNDAGNGDFSDTTSAYTKASTVSMLDSTSTVDSITLESTAFTNPTVGSSGYYFDCTDESCDTGINEWIQTETDSATGLANNTGYEFRVKNRNGDGVENSYSTEQEVWTKADVPTITNTDITDTTITLQGQGVNNYSQGSSGFYFDCVTGSECNTGINEWVSTDTDTVVGLDPDMEYSFKVKARNYDSVETAYSSNSLDVYTYSTQPTISVVDNATTSSLDLTVDNQENPATTTYVVEEVNTAKYVNSSGQLQVDPVWLTYEQLGSENGVTVSGLDSNTEYTFRVKAKNQADVETNYSEPVSEYTQLQAPTLLDPETKTDTSITWEITTTETGYDGIKIYDTEGNLVNTCVGLNITECQETGLDPNTQYSRTVTIYNTNSESVDSSTVSEYTNAQPISISLSSPINYYEVSLNINLEDNPVGTDLEIYEINTEKYFNSNLGILVEDQTDFESTSESVTVSGLSPNTNYQFKVRAIDEEGNSTTWSDPTSVRTYAQVPNIVSATALSTTSGRLTIDLGDNPEGTRISIFESSNRYLKESGEFSDTEQIFDLEGDSIDITGLTSNTTYTFKVRAYNEDNVETNWSSTVDLITLINQPTIEVSEKTKNSVTLEISGLNNISQQSSGAYIERRGEWSQESLQTVTGLKPNTRYVFKVKAKNGNGKETAYKESDATYTLAEIPSISSTSASSATQGVLNVDLGNNPDNTRVSIKETTTNKYLDSNGSLSDTETVLDTEDTQFNISELEANTVYRFKIKAHNEEDIATQYSSSEFTLTTLCGQPTVSIDNITNSSVDINISDVNNITVGDSGILVERLNSWSQDTSQTVDELNPNTSYIFRVKVRNQQGRETSFVSSDSITTLANRPAIESVRKISANSARVYIDTNDNPSNTQYAIRDRISEMYVNQAGTLQDDPVWQTYTQWGASIGKYVTGLEGLRQVGFEVRARNSNGIRTSFSQAEYIGTGSVITNAPSTVSVNLRDNEDVDVSSEAQLGIQDVRITKDEYMIADLKVSFEQDRDWSDAVVDVNFEQSKTVVKVKDTHGVTDPFTMYVVRNDTNAFRICPQADSLDDLKEGCEGEQLLTESFPQEIDIEDTTITISEAKIDGTYYWIADGLTGTGGMGETVETTQDEKEEKEDEEKVIQKIGKRISDTANRVSKDMILGTVEVFDGTPIGDLNRGELSTAVATTTTVTITVGIATTGIVQTFYLFFHFINGVLNALGFVRKRNPFGYVYDSNSKEPISNAVVRIYKGDKLVDTTVTNSKGMFLSNLQEGKYKIKVKKGGYDFPTKLIKGSEDYPLKNIYKGEIIKKTKSSDVIVNIPLDRKELKKTKKFSTILKSTSSIILTFVNILLFTFGILLIVYTYYKYPDLFRWYIPLLYIPALYFLAKSIFGKTVVYGKVVDKKGNPVKDKELFLVNTEFDEVVAKRVTDEKGRYRFVCNKGLYKLRVGKKTVLDNIKVKKDGYVLNKRVKYSS